MSDTNDDILKKPRQDSEGGATPSMAGTPPVAVEDMLRSISNILHGEKTPKSEKTAATTATAATATADAASGDAAAPSRTPHPHRRARKPGKNRPPPRKAEALAPAPSGHSEAAAATATATAETEAEAEATDTQSAQRQQPAAPPSVTQNLPGKATETQEAAKAQEAAKVWETAETRKVAGSPQGASAQDPLDAPLELVDMVDDDGKIVTLPLLARDGASPATPGGGTAAKESALTSGGAGGAEQPSSQASVKLTLDAIGEKVRSHLQDEAVSPGASSAATGSASSDLKSGAPVPDEAFRSAVADAVQAWMDTHLDAMVEKMLTEKLKRSGAKAAASVDARPAKAPRHHLPTGRGRNAHPRA